MIENLLVNGIKIEYQVSFSKRQTVSIKIVPPGLIYVTAPIKIKHLDLVNIVEGKAKWIYKKVCELQNAAIIKAENSSDLTENEKKDKKKQLSLDLKSEIEERINYYRNYLSLRSILPAKISVKSLKSSWGSCSSNRNISFNWKLALAPPEILDYVIVHELCHLVHMNHSLEFWNLVEKVKPDAKACKIWLRKNGFLLDL